MNMAYNLGVNLTEGTNFALEQIMKRYQISRKDARRLLGDALIRTPVLDEIFGSCDWQLQIGPMYEDDV